MLYFMPLIVKRNYSPSVVGLLIVKYGLYYTPFLVFLEAKVTGSYSLFPKIKRPNL
jgi:hypothetical protein